MPIGFFRKFILFLSVILSLGLISYAQNYVRIMTYNILNYPGSDSATRNPYFRTVIDSAKPDILVVQEITSQGGVTGFLNAVMNASGNTYRAGTFINGYDTDNAIFYKTALFNFISNTPIHTALRDINEFKLVHLLTGDTVRIYSLHLKAGDTDTLARLAEVDSLRKVTDALPQGTDFIVCGDFNIYRSTDPSYRRLLQVVSGKEGHFIDPITNMTGIWNNPVYAQYHTQSARVRSFGGGANGGLDDRFDMILYSKATNDSGGITFVKNSLIPYGNDGNHYNDSINEQPNTAVSVTVANALHYASDHLPVYATFSFGEIYLNITAIISGFYNPVTGYMNMKDTVTVYVRNAVTPYDIIDSVNVCVDSLGKATVKFYNVIRYSDYYIVIKHRNSLETWSRSGGILFDNSVMEYDFTKDSAQAYGNNMVKVGNKWCIINGDCNGDNYIDGTDYLEIFNHYDESGYLTGDTNGDMYIDGSDYIPIFNSYDKGAITPLVIKVK